MAGKKIATIDDSVNIFKDVIARAGITDFVYSNHIMISKTPTSGTVIIVPEKDLWNAIIDDESLKSHITEYDEEKHGDIRDKFSYGNHIDNDIWISIDSDIMYRGEILNISIQGFSYKVPINKALIPVRLKKAEYTNFYYSIIKHDNSVVLIMRKKFETPIADTNFNLMTIYQVV